MPPPSSSSSSSSSLPTPSPTPPTQHRRGQRLSSWFRSKCYGTADCVMPPVETVNRNTDTQSCTYPSVVRTSSSGGGDGGDGSSQGRSSVAKIRDVSGYHFGEEDSSGSGDGGGCNIKINSSSGNINSGSGNINSGSGNINSGSGNINSSSGNINSSSGNINSGSGNINSSSNGNSSTSSSSCRRHSSDASSASDADASSAESARTEGMDSAVRVPSGTILGCTAEEKAAAAAGKTFGDGEDTATRMPTTAEPSDPPGDPEEPELLLWRRFSLSQYLSALPVRWRRFVGLFHYTLVARPSNDPSLGLQGWRSGALRRWELKFPVLTVFDAPGQAAPDEGFNEWPLFDIFKIDLRDRPSWSAYLASLRRADRWNVKTRTKLFQLYESEGKLTCQVVRMGPQAFMTQWQQRPVAAPLPAVAAAISCHPSGGGADLGTTWRPKSASIAIGEQQAIDFTPAVSLIDPRVSDEAQPTGILTAATAPTSALAAPTSSASLHPLTPPQPPSLPLPQDWVAEEQKEPHQERQQSDFPPKPLPDQAQKWSRKQQHQKQQQQLPQQQQQQQQQRQQQQSRVTTKPLKHGKRRANSAPGNEVLAPPKLVFATPGSVSEADVLLAQMWNLYEQTGTRNGFVECYREQFERLVREAPNIHAVVVREGGSGSGPLLAFGLLLPQRESLQVLYIGMAYDNPLVRQSSCYFQILSVGLQAALAHNESVRQRSVAAAAAADGGKAFSGSDRAADAAVADVAHTDMRQGFIAGGGGSGGGGGGSGSGSDGGGGGGGSGSGSCSGGRTQSEGAAPIMAAVAPTLNAHAEGTVASFANVWLPPPPPPSAPPPPHPLLLGPRVGLIDWLDLGPGRRFVKEHLGAVGHPVSMYTRGIGPIAQLMSRSLLNRHFSPRAYVNDP